MSLLNSLQMLRRCGACTQEHTQHERERDSLEWMWHINGCKEMLNFICHKVTSDNVVSDAEWKQFKELEQRGQLLRPEQLKRALQDNQLNVVNVEQKKIVQFIGGRSESHRRSLLSVLSETRLSHNEESERLKLIHSEAKKSQRNIIRLSAQLDAVLLRCADVLRAKRDEKLDNAGEDYEGLVADAPLHRYALADDRRTKGIQSLFEALMVHRHKDSTLDNGPEENDREKEYEDNVDELERLRCVIVQSEGKRVEALAKQQKLKSLYNELRLHGADRAQAEGHEELRALLQRNQEKIADVKEKILEPLYRKIASEKLSTVFHGDYSLKIGRLEKSIASQRRVLGELLHQRVSHALLLHKLRREKEQHLSLVILLENSVTRLRQRRIDYEHRQMRYQQLKNAMVGWKTPNPEPSNMKAGVQQQQQNRRTVDARDESTLRLNSILNEMLCRDEEHASGYDDAFVTFEGMNERAKALMEQKRRSKSLVKETDNAFMQSLQNMRAGANELSSLLSRSSSTGSATLSDPALVERIQALQRSLHHFKEKMYALQMEEASKRKLSEQENNSGELNSRNLFIKFFCAPETLEREISALAHKVSRLNLRTS